jgi:hypothetical protein
MLLEIKDLVTKLPKYTHYQHKLLLMHALEHDFCWQIFQNKPPFEIYTYDSLLPIFICETYIYFVWFCGLWSFGLLKHSGYCMYCLFWH